MDLPADVDAVAVLAHRPDARELAALREVHADLAAEGGITRIDLVRAHPDAGIDPALVSWFVLGVPRLHHLLATGAMTKDGAGRFALATYDER